MVRVEISRHYNERGGKQIIFLKIDSAYSVVQLQEFNFTSGRIAIHSMKSCNAGCIAATQVCNAFLLSCNSSMRDCNAGCIATRACNAKVHWCHATYLT